MSIGLNWDSTSSDRYGVAPAMFFHFYQRTLFPAWTLLLALHSLQATPACACETECDLEHRAIICPKLSLPKIPSFKKKCRTAISLDLSINNITDISREDFNNLSGLKTDLLLARNFIQEINNNTFINLIKLKRLDLQNNQLHELKPGSFTGLKNLTKLNLDRNKLTAIESGVFGSELQMVESLGLANNVIQNISSGSFVGMSKLEVINLRNNSITILLSYTFKGLGNVKKIDLSHNNIKVMNKSAFSDLASLASLNLSFNSIVSVEAIHDLRLLDVLDLYQNSITKLNSFLNGHLQSKNYRLDINVSSNPLDCECESIQPLLDWYNDKEKEVSNGIGVNNSVAECSTPKKEKLSKINCDKETQSPTDLRTVASGYTTSSKNDASIMEPTQSMRGTYSTVVGVIIGLLIICSVVLSWKSYRKYRRFTQSRPMVPVAQLSNPTPLPSHQPSFPRLPVTPGCPIVPRRNISRHSMLSLWSQGRIYFSHIRSSPQQSFTHQPDRHDVSMTEHLSAVSTSTGFQTTSSVSWRLSNLRAKPSAFCDRTGSTHGGRILPPWSTTPFSPRPSSQVQSYITRIFTGNRRRLQPQPVSQDIFAPTPNGDIIHTQDKWDVNTAIDDHNFFTAPYSSDHDNTTHWVQPSRVPLSSPMATEYPCDSSRAEPPAIPKRKGSTPRPIGSSVIGYSTQINHKLRRKPTPPLDPDIMTTTDQAAPVPSLAGHFILSNSCSSMYTNCSGLSTTVGQKDRPPVPQRPSRNNNVKQTTRAWLQEDNGDFRSVTGCDATSSDRPPAPSIAGHMMVSTSCSLNMLPNHETPHLEKVSPGFSRIDDTSRSTPCVAPRLYMNRTNPLSRSTSSSQWSLRFTKSCL